MSLSSTAIMFHILPGMTPKVLEFTREALGPRLGEHDESRKRLGIAVENAWIENTNEGDLLIFYFEGKNLEESFKKMGESELIYDLWFRDKMFALTGADLCDFRMFAPSELVFESPVLEPKGPLGSVATVYPVLPGKKDEWIALLEELQGPRDEEDRGYLWRYGLTIEKLFVQTTPKGEMVILYAEGDDPADAISRFARSHHPFDVWLREEMLYLNGIDFIRRQTAPPPHLVLDWKTGVRAKAA